MTTSIPPSISETINTLNDAFGSLSMGEGEKRSSKGQVRTVALIGGTGLGKTWTIRRFYEELSEMQTFWPTHLNPSSPDSITPTLPERFEEKPKFVWWGVRFSGSDTRNPSLSSLGLEQLDAMTEALLDGFNDYRLNAAKRVMHIALKELVALAPLTPAVNLYNDLKGIVSDFADDRRISRTANPLQRREEVTRLARYQETIQSLNQLLSPHGAGLPLILVLDDLHNVGFDRFAREFVTLLISHAKELNWNVLIIAASWPDSWHGSVTNGSQAFLMAALNDKDSLPEVCPIEPADRHEVLERIEESIPAIPLGQANSIVEHVGGNRLALFELLKELQHSPAMFEDGKVHGRIIAQSLTRLLDRDRERRLHFSQRLNQASDRLQIGAFAASCMGEEVSALILHKALSLATCQEPDPDLPDALIRLGLLHRTNDGIFFASRDAFHAAQRLEFRLAQSREVKSRVQEVVTEVCARVSSSLTPALRSEGKDDRPRYYRIGFHGLSQCSEAPLRYAGLRAGYLYMNHLTTEDQLIEAAQLAEVLATAPAAVFESRQWCHLAWQMRVASREDFRQMCLSKAELTAKRPLDEARVTLANVDSSMDTALIGASLKKAEQLIEAATQGNAEETELALVINSLRFKKICFEATEPERLSERISEFQKHCLETERLCRAKNDNIGARFCVEKAAMSVAPYISGAVTAEPDYVEGILSKHIERISSEFGDNPNSIALTLLMAGYDEWKSSQAKSLSDSITFMRYAVDRIAKFYSTYSAPGILKPYLHLTDTLRDLLRTYLGELRDTLRSYDENDGMQYRSVISPEADAYKEIRVEVTRLNMLISRLHFLIAEFDEDISGMISAMETQWVVSDEKQTEELGAILQEEKAELSEVQLALARRSFDLSFRLIEASHEDPGVIYSFTRLTNHFTDALLERLPNIYDSDEASEKRTIEIFEEVTSVYTRAITSVRHWPWPIASYARSTSLLNLILDKLGAMQKMELSALCCDYPSFSELLRNRRRADYFDFISELEVAPLEKEQKSELKTTLDYHTSTRGDALMATRIGVPVKTSSGLWGFEYDGTSIPSEVLASTILLAS